MRLNGLVINGRVSVIYMMVLLGFSPLKVFFFNFKGQLEYGHGLIVWMTTIDESCKLEPSSTNNISCYNIRDLSSFTWTFIWFKNTIINEG